MSFVALSKLVPNKRECLCRFVGTDCLLCDTNNTIALPLHTLSEYNNLNTFIDWQWLTRFYLRLQLGIKEIEPSVTIITLYLKGYVNKHNLTNNIRNQQANDLFNNFSGFLIEQHRGEVFNDITLCNTLF